jgi:hypothetical protein
MAAAVVLPVAAVPVASAPAAASSVPVASAPGGGAAGPKGGGGGGGGGDGVRGRGRAPADAKDKDEGNQVWVSWQRRPAFYGSIACRMFKTHETVEVHGLGNGMNLADAHSERLND